MYLYIKRMLDFIVALILLVLLSPLLLIVACLVRIKIGKPVLFKQERPGKNSKIFCLYKFRTMTNQKDSEGNLLSDVERLKSFGLKLRGTSLDELPELFNIIKGDMSFVGPRPLLVKYLPLYNTSQQRRHSVRPGLTGLAQVNGRNSLSWEQKLNYDVEYVDNLSFLLDMKILFKTIKVVVKRDGISSETSKTMEEFQGDCK